MCGFIAHLPVEHCTGIAEVTGPNPVEALFFFRLLLTNFLPWSVWCNLCDFNITSATRYTCQHACVRVREQHERNPSDIDLGFKIIQKRQSNFDCLIYEILLI